MWLPINKCILCLLGSLWLGVGVAHAQLQPELPMGNAPVRSMQRTQWQMLAAESIDVQYPQGQRLFAENTARLANKAYYELTVLLNYYPNTRMWVQAYPGRAAFTQADFTHTPYLAGTGHVNLIQVYFPGTQQAYYSQILSAMARAFMRDLFFGSADQVAFQNKVLLYLPNWYQDGLADYLGYGWLPQDEVNLRGTDPLRLHHLVQDPLPSDTRRSARKSIWHFVERKYGRRKLVEIIYMTRLSRSVEGGIQTVLGTSLSNFTTMWLNEARDAYTPEQAAEPWQAPAVAPHKKLAPYAGLATHPTTGQAAYLSLHDGVFHLYTLKPGDPHPHRQRFSTGVAQRHPAYEDLVVPMAWHPAGQELAFYLPLNGQGYLYYYNLASQRYKRFAVKTPIDEVYELAYAPGGQHLAFSALSNGQTDLYRTAHGQWSPTAITRDRWDDRHPVWTPDGKGLYLASNRGFDINKTPTDTPPGLEGFDRPLNLYLLEDVGSSEYFTLLQLATYYAEYPVHATPEGVFTHTHYSGLPNLAFLSAQDGSYHWVTDYREGLHQGLPLNATHWLGWGVQDGRHRLLHLPTPSPTTQLTPQRNRESLHWETRYKRVEALRNPPPPTPTKQPDTPKDTLQAPPPKADTVRVKVRYYVFDEDEAPSTKPQRSGSRFVPGSKKTDPPKRLPPELFRTDSVRIAGATARTPGLLMRGVQTDIVTDPYAGLGMDARLLLQDGLGRHTFLLGARPYIDFRSMDAYARYHYRQYRVQPYSMLTRQSRFFGGPDFYSVRSLRFTQGVEYAHSQFLQYGLAFSGAQLVRKDLNLLDVLDEDARQQVYTLTAHARLHRLRTQDHFTLQGYHLSLQADAHRSGAVQSQTLRLDARYYLPLVAHTVLAMRLTGGVNIGDLRQQFMMGGVENWVYKYEFDNRQDIPLSTDLASFYLNQVGPYLRGTPFNNRNGWQYVTAHAEWRIPVTRLFNSALYGGPLYNVQFIAFYELGTVWRTGNPLSQRNPIDASTIVRGPITAVVQSLKSPFVQSFGVGFRTLVVGYFTRFDLSWPLEENEVVGTRFSVAVGKDF